MSNINEVNKTASRMATIEHDNKKEPEKKKEFKKPADIYYETKPMGVIPQSQFIVHEAVNEKTYNKLYYTSYEAYKKGDTARRTKVINLPQNREKIKFNDVHTLWDHLIKNCGYKVL